MRRNKAPRGFSFLEGLVTLVILIVVMIGLLNMLESSTRITKQETNVADAQASGRSGLSYVTRILREARVGKLSYGNAVLPYAENVAAGTTLTDLAAVSHTLRTGTDAIEARGVFNGETVVFGPADVTCGASPCTLGSSALRVTIRQTTGAGYMNYPAGGAPSIRNRTTSFYFVVAAAASQAVGVGTNSYVVPLYVVGRVDTGAGWYTQDSTSFSFTMDATDSGARAIQATSDTAAQLQSPTTGGPVDDVVFFVDRGELDPRTSLYTHPYLAQATRDPATARWDVQVVAPEVEDFQIAYGIDGADGSARDRGVDPAKLSTAVNGDEWVFSAAGETLSEQTSPRRIDAFYDSSVASAPPYPLPAVSALRAVLVSLVVKSADPDQVYAGPGAYGFKLLDSTALSVSASTNRPYRRRVQTMAIDLRNYL